MIRTCLLGLGRTGMVIAEELLKAPDFKLITAMARPNSPKKGKVLADYILGGSQLTIQSTDILADEVRRHQWDVSIDFTSPEATLKNARILAEHGVPMVIGTTGFNTMEVYELKNLALKNQVGMVYAPNISLGINLLLTIVKTISRLLPDYDVEITESHHRHKKDSPSGTALKIAHEIAAVRKHKNHKYIHGRKGMHLRDKSEIGIHAIRAGGIVGVHEILFAGESDEIKITHRSYSRKVFAEGALQAARFVTKRIGFFSMEDVIRAELEREAVSMEASGIAPLDYTGALEA